MNLHSTGSNAQEDLEYTYTLISAIKWWKERHKQNKKTQKNMGNTLKVHQTTISKWLNSVKKIEHQGEMRYDKISPILTYPNACRICEAMDTTIGEVLYAYEHREETSSKSTNYEMKKKDAHCKMKLQ